MCGGQCTTLGKRSYTLHVGNLESGEAGVFLYAHVMLLMVWAASSFNSLVLLSGLFWFGVKWVEVSTNLVWFGFSSQWAGLKWIELSFSSLFVDLEGLF
jgi:hypothetical protein